MEFIAANDLLAGSEITGAKKVLRAAALTYVAALLTTLMNFIRLFLMARGRRR
jgi:hypothetical protein